MATQTRFDLNAAVDNWRNELAAQPQLTPDDRRELEKHLADSMAGLRDRGLNDEESFWLATRRIGQPQQLAEEFEKVDPQNIWRERAFCMVLALLTFSLWQSFVDLFLNLYREKITEFILCRFVLVFFLPIIIFLLAQRWAVKTVATFCAIFKTRWRFTVNMILWIAIVHSFGIFSAFEDYRFRMQLAGRASRPLSTHALDGFWLNQFAYNGYPLMLLAVAIWLLPTHTQLRRTEKPA